MTAEDTHAQIARAVRNGFECGEVDPESDPDVAAARLAAVAEGPAIQVHRGSSEAATRARAAVRAEVDAVFSGECRQYTR
ncbi:TetR family transcriptional regulator C-terminal domain-containing protein [Nocardiopsis sp. JB363]|uniref:TetR family transcriptional regulator C-terminal domain-containing protein n=1 Tax=Nocardiopsis sp. JB363 TaxID=1434837 RepID=UPI00097B61F3|nr:TetR family transcriptional regulator C-terminal domain-containing protein [Nocardiopsis sp. JB363]SIO86763.1 Transcriptional regulator, TetR family [Nocardiopsis sp. JB363]